jgi:hypothetical protein
VAAGAALLALLAACSSSGQSASAGPENNPVNTGPFGGQGETIGTVCVPVKPGQVVADGINAINNRESATAVIDRVGLVSPQRLRILAAYVVPITGHVLYGAQPGDPPIPGAPPGFQWGERQQAEGARVPHTSGYHVMSLLLVLSTHGSRSTDKGVDVWYHVGGQHYHLRTGVGMLALVAQSCPG